MSSSKPFPILSMWFLAVVLPITTRTAPAQGDDNPDQPKYFVSPGYGTFYQHISDTRVLTKVINPSDGKITKRRTAGGFTGPFDELITTSQVSMVSGYDKIFNNTIAGFPVRVSKAGDVLLYVGNTTSNLIPTSSAGAIWKADDSVVRFVPTGEAKFVVPRDMNDNLTVVGEMLYDYKNQFDQERRRAVAVKVSPSGTITQITPARFSTYGFKLEDDPDGGRPDVVMDNQATAMAINSAGDVVCDAHGLFRHAATGRLIKEKFSFISKNGAATVSNLPEGAMDINDRGEVVGYNNTSRTWLYLPKANYGLGAGTHTIDSVEYEPEDYPMRVRINNRGDVTWVSAYTAVTGLSQRTPALWRQGKKYALTSLYDTDESFSLRQVLDVNEMGDLLVDTEWECEFNGQTFTCIGSRILSLSPFAQKLVVNSNSDESDADPNDEVIDTDLEKSGNQVTLRAAIEAVNDGSDLPIEFNIDVDGGGIPFIPIVKALPSITRPVVIDGTTQGGGFVEIRGNAVNAPGIHLMGGSSEVRGMIIHSVQGKGAAAIKISGAGENKILGCRLGTDASGNAVRATSVGVQINGSPNNQIGGDKDGEANVIHATDLSVKIEGAGANENMILGNRIGIGVNGDILKPLANGGVVVEQGDRNVIGGTDGRGNLIACGGSVVAGGVHKITGLEIIGNRIGLNAAGTASGGGSQGILLAGTKGAELTNATIRHNKVAGNVFNLIAFGSEGGVRDVDIEDNEIGLRFDSSGNVPEGVEESQLYGIRFDAVSDANLKRNRIVGNRWNVMIAGTVQLFTVGEDTDGDGEDDSWGLIDLTPLNPDEPDDDEFKAENVKVENNTIGINRTDKVPEGVDQVAGVVTFGNAGRTTIRNNSIAGHKGNQVWLQDGAGHVVSGNTIGTADGTAIGSEVGVFVQNTERATIAIANVISGNSVAGVLIAGEAKDTTIRGNRIGTNPSGNESWPNGNGIAVTKSEDDLPQGIVIEANTISGNRMAGVFIDTASRVELTGNRIGIGLEGDPLPNQSGIIFESGHGMLIENRIAHNLERGVFVHSESSEVKISSGFIYANGGGIGAAGIFYEDAPLNPPGRVVGLRSAPDRFGTVRLTFAVPARSNADGEGAAILEIFGNTTDTEHQGQEFLFRKIIDPAEPFVTTVEVPAGSQMAKVKNFTATFTEGENTSAFSSHGMAEVIVWPELDIAETNVPGEITLVWPDSPRFRLETYSDVFPEWREANVQVRKEGETRTATLQVSEDFETEMFRLALDQESLLE